MEFFFPENLKEIFPENELSQIKEEPQFKFLNETLTTCTALLGLIPSANAGFTIIPIIQ